MRTGLVLSLLWLSACAEPSNATVQKCVDQCDRAGGCPGGAGNCLDVCEAQYEEATRVACVPEYEAIVECTAALKDVCDDSSCSTELSSYTICFGEFCGTHPTDPSCPEPTGTGGGS